MAAPSWIYRHQVNIFTLKHPLALAKDWVEVLQMNTPPYTTSGPLKVTRETKVLWRYVFWETVPLNIFYSRLMENPGDSLAHKPSHCVIHLSSSPAPPHPHPPPLKQHNGPFQSDPYLPNNTRLWKDPYRVAANAPVGPGEWKMLPAETA